MPITRDDVLRALAPVMEVVKSISPDAADAATELQKALPLSHPALVAVREIVRQGVLEKSLAVRESQAPGGGVVRFERLHKATDPQSLSVDLVHMSSPGPGHRHPNGEIDLCFAVDSGATFDGRAEGWTVYGKESWHVPTVASGSMDILYFLPGGAIVFDA